MSNMMKRLEVVVFLFILAILIATPCLGTGTKTAYTRDGVNFISKHRVDENIQVGIAKPGDYKEVQVPLNTFVLGGFLENSIYSHPNTSKQTKSANSYPADTSKQNKTETAQLSKETQIASTATLYNGNGEILLILYISIFVLFLICLGKQNIVSLGNKQSSADMKMKSETDEPTK